MSTQPSSSSSTRPNILFILTDDWGYGDLGCYGNETVQTPCLDRFAEQGTRFNRFYVTSPVCSPSRCSFITGHYPGRWQVHAVSFPMGFGAALADADTNGNGHIDSDTELDLALMAGTAVHEGVVLMFECPVIPMPKGHR